MATVSPQFIIEGLKRRGYPEHVAQGFVMNMMDESGLNPGINEAAPIVPGSRGGFGLYQLTGPRRTAYEQFAAQRGVNPADAEAQLDFLDYELKGPESRAAKSILSTQNAQQAAVAIARDFLRPATEHLQNRVARYSGADVAADTMAALGKGGGTVTPDQIAQGAMAQSAGQEPEQPRGLLGNLFGNPDTMAALAMAFNSMRLNPDPNLSAVLSAQMKERRDERKERVKRNATADELDKIAPGAGDLVRAGIFSGSEALKFIKDKESMTIAQQASEAMARGDYQTAYALSMRLSPTAAGQAIAQQLGPRRPEVIAGGKYTTTYVNGQPVVTPNQAVIDAERQLLEQEREAERLSKGLPTTAQKAEEADFDALGAIDMISAEIARMERLFGFNEKTGEFEGPLQFGAKGLISGGLGSIGFGEANEKVARAREDYETFKTRLVNESLRLNKGVQTEGDAQRAMNELGGARTTAEAYAAIQKLQRINERARQLRERSIRTRRERYGLPGAKIPQYAPTWEVVE